MPVSLRANGCFFFTPHMWRTGVRQSEEPFGVWVQGTAPSTGQLAELQLQSRHARRLHGCESRPAASFILFHSSHTITWSRLGPAPRSSPVQF